MARQVTMARRTLRTYHGAVRLFTACLIPLAAACVHEPKGTSATVVLKPAIASDVVAAPNASTLQKKPISTQMHFGGPDIGDPSVSGFVEKTGVSCVSENGVLAETTMTQLGLEKCRAKGTGAATIRLLVKGNLATVQGIDDSTLSAAPLECARRAILQQGAWQVDGPAQSFVCRVVVN